MLGVMKAGGAFVPLDPTHPTSRLQNLITSVQAAVVLCSDTRAEKLRPVVKTLIPLNTETLDRLSDADSVDLASGVTSQKAAYVLFTSGSTGEPKVRDTVTPAICRDSAADLDTSAGNLAGAPRIPLECHSAWTRPARVPRLALSPVCRAHVRC
jgi:non-ribosomal peptide synthetase component F